MIRRIFLQLLTSIPFVGLLSKPRTVVEIAPGLKTRGPLLAHGTTLLQCRVTSMVVFDDDGKAKNKFITGFVRYCGKESHTVYQHARFNVVGILKNLGYDVDYGSLKIEATQTLFEKVVELEFSCRAE